MLTQHSCWTQLMCIISICVFLDQGMHVTIVFKYISLKRWTEGMRSMKRVSVCLITCGYGQGPVIPVLVAKGLLNPSGIKSAEQH